MSKTLQEVSINITLGFCVNWFLTYNVLPFIGLYPSVRESLGVTVVFTVFSFIRLYLVRMFFMKGLHGK